MAASWLLKAIYTSLLSQSAITTDKPLTTDSKTYVTTTTAYGELRGLRKLTATNVLIDSYLGIPFAQPPVGSRRFSRPEPPAKWSGVRDATRFGHECHQLSAPKFTFHLGEKPFGRSENCLYLNVYAPNQAINHADLAVMVWIHGGGYFMGSGSYYDGSELAATGVIVVTINYRLDIFGFLSSEDDTIPGNFGMLDQIMALKWVKENIRDFGGDPDKITIFGESAGSTSISLLILSPLASGLFHRAIMESGTSLSPWAITTPAARIMPRAMLSLIGNAVGCAGYDMSKKLQCLRNVDALHLLNASLNVENAFPTATLFAPRVENTFSFLPEMPLSLFTHNKFNHVDTIHGFNTDESGEYIVDEEDDGISKDEFLSLLKEILEPYAISDRDMIVNEIVATYIGNETDKKYIRYAMVRAISDFDYIKATTVEANIQSKFAKGNVHYLYQFNHKPSYSKIPVWLNATHGEDVPFVFGLPKDKSPSKEDKIVRNQIKIMWSNFAKYGNPTQTVPAGAVSWTPYTLNEPKYLKIDTVSQILPIKNTNATALFNKVLQRLQTTYRPDTIVG